MAVRPGLRSSGRQREVVDQPMAAWGGSWAWRWGWRLEAENGTWGWGVNAGHGVSLSSEGLEAR